MGIKTAACLIPISAFIALLLLVTQDIFPLQWSPGTKLMSQVPAAPEGGAGVQQEGAVITTLITKFSAEQARFFNSIKRFEPDATVYVSCSTDVAAAIQKASVGCCKKLQLEVRLDRYVGLSRAQMERQGIWTKFQMEKAAILRIALKNERRRGAWYMDGDMFLLAPMPRIAAEVGLSHHRCSPNVTERVGTYNGGCVFFRSEVALTAWEQAAPDARTKCCKDQTSLEDVAWKFKSSFQEVGCSVNVGWWRIDPESNNGYTQIDRLRCTQGQVQFDGCTIQSMHYHIGDRQTELIGPALDKVVRECNHPVLPILLESYG